jgi:hypothetical protein
MKKVMRILLIVITALMTCAMPGQAERFHGGGHGGGWGWGPAIGLGVLGLGVWELSRPYYPYSYQTPVVVEQPPTEIYVQPAPPQQPVETNYWYYCQNPEGYYPYVKYCPKGWMKVIPSPPPPER